MGFYRDGELTGFHPSGTVMGTARIDGRPAALVGSDFTARPKSGSQAEGGASQIHSGGDKSAHIEGLAQELKIPLIRLIDGFGGDIRATAERAAPTCPSCTGQNAGRGCWPRCRWSRRRWGRWAGLPAAEVPASHFSVMVRGTTQVFAGGPPLVKRSLGDPITKEDLGGYKVHARHSGVVDNDAADEAEALGQIRAFLSYLPSSVHDLPPVRPCDDPVDRREEGLASIVPRHRNRGYDTRKLVRMVVDAGSFFEMGRYFGRAQVTAFARIGGMPVGVLANDPMHYGGAMGAKEARKFERFVDLCDVFHLPIINFADQRAS